MLDLVNINIWDRFIEKLILFNCFGSIYYALEILYDGSSHWSMYVCGGLSGLVGDFLCQHRARISLILRAVYITIAILVFEYAAGLLFNIYLGMNIWDYSQIPLNLHGQICIRFALIWFFIFSPIILWSSGIFRYLLFGDKRPIRLRSIYTGMAKEIKDYFLEIRVKLG